MEQSDIDNQFIRMMNSLQASLLNDEDLTVIVADAFAFKSDEDLSSTRAEDIPKEQRPPVAAKPNEVDEIDRQKAANQLRAEQERARENNAFHNRLTCFAGSVFEPDAPSLPEVPTCNTLLATVNSRDPLEEVNSIMPAASHPSASAMRAGAQAWRARHRQEPRSGINFRTGMSGHMGVMGTHARHPHEYLEGSAIDTHRHQQHHRHQLTLQHLQFVC